MLRRITLKQIEAFYWTAELGSFSAAAGRLNTTQPAISNRIREFESALDVRLFDADVRAPRLSPKGREVLAVCEQFLHLGKALEDTLGSGESVGGLVRVGAADTVALTWLPTLVSRLRTQYPQVEVELIVDLSIHLQARLRERALDIAFLVGPLSDPDVTTRHLGDVRNAWMCAPGLVRGAGKAVTPRDLAALPVFIHSRGSHLHQTALRWFEAHNVRPTRVHGCNSLSTMIRMTIAGLGVSVLPVDMLRAEVRRKALVTLDVKQGFPANRFLVAHQSKTFDRTVQVISNLAVDLAAESGLFRIDGAAVRHGRSRRPR
ncbi:MAG: LysR family transcriptional regulator [Burkholderiales bacterium]|nr:LysR family transcriptional regulator [Burkholderiales bacterium]